MADSLLVGHLGSESDWQHGNPVMDGVQSSSMLQGFRGTSGELMTAHASSSARTQRTSTCPRTVCSATVGTSRLRAIPTGYSAAVDFCVFSFTCSPMCSWSTRDRNGKVAKGHSLPATVPFPVLRYHSSQQRNPRLEDCAKSQRQHGRTIGCLMDNFVVPECYMVQPPDVFGSLALEFFHIELVQSDTTDHCGYRTTANQLDFKARVDSRTDTLHSTISLREGVLVVVLVTHAEHSRFGKRYLESPFAGVRERF